MDSNAPNPQVVAKMEAQAAAGTGKVEDLIKHTKPLPRKDCVICARKLAINQFPRQKHTPNCVHERETCRHCFKNYIHAELMTKSPDQISCPECPNILQHEEVKALASPDTFQRYITIKTFTLTTIRVPC